MVVAGTSVPIYVTPDAQLKYLKFGEGAFDQDLISIAEKYIKPGHNVWDIGANVGTFAFSCGHIAKEGTVVAVEPDTWLASIIRRTARLDSYSRCNIIVIPAAISNECSVASFLVATRGRASNALKAAKGHSQMGGVREVQYVPTLTLDTLLKTFTAPDFVKIDIEGAEYLALQGAAQLISTVRPIFYIEVSNDLSAQIFDIFKSAGYHALDPDGQELTARCAPNTLFVPAEKTRAVD